MNSIIPRPQIIETSKGYKTISDESSIYVSYQLSEITDILKEEFPVLGNAVYMNGDMQKADICFIYSRELEDEAYKITIDEKGLCFEASGYAGAFYAVQTLKQILFFDAAEKEIKVPFLSIYDQPRFKHRGLMLDESRHFFGKEECKRILKLMSLYKLNTFHWHLTDDQGWRIEIKKYPLLTQIGSKRKDTGIHGWKSTDMLGKPHEGYYTQEEIREIVAYAKRLNITVIPEIDMPAHFAAAMASYNHLACREIPCEVHWFFGGYVPTKMGWKDWNRSACPGKESTYQFIFDVIDEVSELFPSPYFHIGGDEAPKDEWKKCPHCQKRMKDNRLKNEEELQGYFNNRVSEYLKSKGKRLIVWNEALCADNLDNGTVGQYWTQKKDANVKKHLKNGGKIIISKHQAFYFDMCHSQYPLKNTYQFEPTKRMIPEKYVGQVLGMEGELWTEWVDCREKIDVQLFPRVLALSEICWVTDRKKNMDEFLERMNEHKKILASLGVNYAEDEVSMPRGIFNRKKETAIWYKSDQHRDVRKNREIKVKSK
ncbi:MAG: beta-N-acetylhexosaminidase [Acutalibacteraceae bacterium]